MEDTWIYVAIAYGLGILSTIWFGELFKEIRKK
jgi:hypothetical protein